MLSSNSRICARCGGKGSNSAACRYSNSSKQSSGRVVSDVRSCWRSPMAILRSRTLPSTAMRYCHKWMAPRFRRKELRATNRLLILSFRSGRRVYQNTGIVSNRGTSVAPKLVLPTPPALPSHHRTMLSQPTQTLHHSRSAP